jgi:hypothetical protein
MRKKATASAAIAGAPLPAGSLVDGVDCAGMIDDPKQAGIPVYLQTQNRRALSPELKEKLDAAKRAARSAERAKASERKAMAKNLGMSPFQMRSTGAPLKSETKAKDKATMAKSAKTSARRSSTKASAAGARARYDWNGAAERAAKGTMPKALDFSAPTHDRFRDLLAEVEKAAKAGDVDALRKIKIAPTSSSPKAIKRYRDLCVVALENKAA